VGGGRRCTGGERRRDSGFKGRLMCGGQVRGRREGLGKEKGRGGAG